MTSANINKLHKDGNPNCKCQEYKQRIQKLEQVLTEREEEISHLYRLHEDDLFRIEKLEEGLSRAHSDTNKEGEKIGDKRSKLHFKSR
jgi:predicted  nucleic acid-binding Zn-ribbon protein